MGLQWYGTDIEATLDAKVLDGCLAAAEYLKGAVQMKVSEVGPPRSKPGKPPHVDTGEFQDSFEVIPIVGAATEARGRGYAVGSSLDRAVWLELGTSRMLPRPYFTVTAMEEMDEMARLVAGKAVASSGAAVLVHA